MTNLEYGYASELEARRKLQLPRRAHRLHPAEAGRVALLRGEVGRRRVNPARRRVEPLHFERRVDVEVLRVIERIKGVKPDLDLRLLFEPEPLCEREVEVVDRRAVEIIAPRLVARTAGAGDRESRDVKLPVGVAARSAARILEQDDARALDTLRP